MTYDPEWYLRDDHPDAEEHRKFLGIDKKGRPLAAPAPALPPARPRRPTVRKALIRRAAKPEDGFLIRMTGAFERPELELVFEYIDRSIETLAKEVCELRKKDIEGGSAGAR